MSVLMYILRFIHVYALSWRTSKQKMLLKLRKDRQPAVPEPQALIYPNTAAQRGSRNHYYKPE